MTSSLFSEDDSGLAGKVAIVTGSGAIDDGIGNGRAAAILLARAGTHVMVVDREQAAAARTVEMIAAEGGTADVCVADLADEADCAAMVKATLDRFGRLDFLDNNVGIARRNTVVEEDTEGWQRVMQVNVETMFLASKHAIPAMLASAGGGAIVNISSISALMPRGLTAYAASKGAIIALTKHTARYGGNHNIYCNTVSPAIIATDLNADFDRPPVERVPLGRYGESEDVAEPIRFLCSPASNYVTGVVIPIAGGFFLGL